MVDKKTVLILGAGASYEYGYPLGSGLKTKILNNISLDPSFLNVYKILGKIRLEKGCITPFDKFQYLHINCGFEVDYIRTFFDDFKTSPNYSIDSFLENRPEFLPIGKALITMSILSCENGGKLFSEKYEDLHWYKYLFNKMSSTWNSFQDNNISIITYNYDRSFEFFFIRALQASYGKGVQHCREKISSIPIVHVHGMIAPTALQPGVRVYGAETLPFHIDEGTKELKIISEEDGLKQKYEEVHKLLKDAEQIFILGFGFDKRNLERLNLKDIEAPIYASRTGITDLELNEINGMSYNKIKFGILESHNIVDFLKNEVSLTGAKSKDIHMFNRSIYNHSVVSMSDISSVHFS